MRFSPTYLLTAAALMAVSGMAEAQNAMPPQPQPAAQTMVAPPPQMQAVREPLLIVRFNQKRVYYDRALSAAVRKAQDAKRDVVFDVVSFVPPFAGNAGERDRYFAEAHQKLNEVANAIGAQGVYPANVSTSMEESPAVPTQEVHVFVR